LIGGVAMFFFTWGLAFAVRLGRTPGKLYIALADERDALAERLRPRLELELADRRKQSGVVTLKGSNAPPPVFGYYIHLAVRPSGATSVKDCSVRLFEIEEMRADGQFQKTSWIASQPLRWVGDKDKFEPVDLPAGDVRLVDFIVYSNKAPRAHICAESSHPMREFPAGTYRMVLRAVGTNVPPSAPLTLDIAWNGTWTGSLDDFRIAKV
jgi:hypothetical protein